MAKSDNNKQSFDIAILGGGPAGLATAIACAMQTDASIVLVEQQAPQQLRVGENIPPETLILLRKLRLDKAFRNGDHQPCPGFASVWGKSDVGYNDFIVNPMGHSWRLNRRAFDQAMVDKAEELGVTLLWQTRFQEVIEERVTLTEEQSIEEQSIEERATETKTNRVQLLLQQKIKDTDLATRGPQKLQLQPQFSTSELTVSAKLVIDATGSTALFAKSQNCRKIIDDKLIATVRFANFNNEVKGKQVRIEATREGWCYHTVLPQQKVVSMMVTLPEELPRLKANGYQHFEDYLAHTQFVGEHLKKIQLNDAKYHSYPINSGQLDCLEGRNWFAVGDAAASFDPIAAQGIYKALHHGLMAGDKAAAWLKGENIELDYSQVITQQYQHYLKNRHYMYQLEKRWPESNFWRNSHKTAKSGKRIATI